MMIKQSIETVMLNIWLNIIDNLIVYTFDLYTECIKHTETNVQIIIKLTIG